MRQDEWVPVDGKELEENAIKVVRNQGCVVVTAGPGAGKTEMLAQKACFLLQTGVCSYPRRILAVSFKKDAAAELEKRVNNRCGNLAQGSFTSLTFDAFAKSILDRFRLALPENMRPSADYSLGAPKEDELFRELVVEQNCRYGSPSNREYDEFEKDIVSAIVKENMSDVGGAPAHLMAGNGDHRSHLSYKMVFALAFLIVKNNPTIKRVIRLTYSHVFLDEFQDITDAQYAMIKELFCGSASITAVGDDKQRIMDFAGAMQNSFESFEKDFSAESQTLYMNYRSAPRLVNLQKSTYKLLNREEDIATIPRAWDEDGELRLVKSRNDSHEAVWLANDIEELLKAGVPAKEIGVLRKLKTDAYVKPLVQELNRRGIHSIDESSIDVEPILDDSFIQFLLSFSWIALGGSDADSWQIVRHALSVLLGFYDDDEQFIDLHSQEIEVEEKRIALGRQLSTAKNEHDIEAAFVEICCKWIGIENIASLNSLYTKAFLDERLSILCKALHARTLELGSIKDSIEVLFKRNAVRLMTIHKSKGMEFEFVYLIGLEDNAFWNMNSDAKAERRAFFVALSRAKKSITFTFCLKRVLLKDKNQTAYKVSEFYDILKGSGFATIVDNISNPPIQNHNVVREDMNACTPKDVVSSEITYSCGT